MEFVTFELAKKIKEKGYPQRTFGEFDMMGACYFKDGRFYKDGCIAHIKDCCAAPQIHEVLKWLRKEKKIYVTVDVEREDWFEYKIVQTIKNTHCTGTKVYETYDNAKLAGIEYVLDNLI